MDTGKAAQRHFLITVQGVDGTWQTFAGGNASADVTKSYDGGAEDPDVLTGPVTYSDVTIGRDYKRERDRATIAFLRPQVRKLRTAIVKQDLDDDMVRVGSPTAYYGTLVGLNDPDTDSGGNTPGRLELTFSIARVV